MAVNGMNGVSKDRESYWKVGLVNYENKYLTAETFGFGINVTGTSLKKKQVFTLVQDSDSEVVYIKSHLGRYLSSNRYGEVTCKQEEAGFSEMFTVEYDKESTGRWAFRHKEHSNYLGGTDNNLICFAQNFTDKELWTVQLSIHPQVHLRNVNRKRYVHVFDDQLQANQTIPWGVKSLIFLVFSEGRYSLKTYDGRYLLPSGELSPDLTEQARFTLEIRSGQMAGLAFRDGQGQYLTGVGSTATLKSRKKSVNKDELFTLEDTHPQVVLYALNTGKKVSIKQGVDVSANQEEEEGDKEIFQMEYQRPQGKWAFLTVDNKYWAEKAGGIQAVSSEVSADAVFEVEWQADGTVAMRAPSGSYLYNKRTGSLVSGGEAVTDKEKFKVKVVNRPALVLRCDHGFVGTKGTDLVCNKAAFEVICLQHCEGEPGVYHFKASNGKYWSALEDGNMVADGSDKSKFQLQVRDDRKLTIYSLVNKCFLKGEQNGLFRAIGTEVDSSTLWEY